MQVNAIYLQAGARGEDTDNGVVLVQSDVAVFSYAAVIDNNTSDPYLVLGAADRPRHRARRERRSTADQDRDADSEPHAAVLAHAYAFRQRLADRDAHSARQRFAADRAGADGTQRAPSSAPRGGGVAPAPGQRSAPARGPARVASLDERLLAILRDPRATQGGW